MIIRTPSHPPTPNNLETLNESGFAESLTLSDDIAIEPKSPKNNIITVPVIDSMNERVNSSIMTMYPMMFDFRATIINAQLYIRW